MGVNAWKNSVTLQNDGKIIVAGHKVNSTDNDFSLVCYNPDGSLDNSFGSGGVVTTDFGGNDDKAMSVIVQSDGKIVASGMSYNGSDFDFAVARYIGSPVGIQENKVIGSVNIYPNPAPGIFVVELANGPVEATISVYDLLGNCLLNKNCGTDLRIKIDLSSQAQGVYFMEIMSGGEKSMNKIVLQ